VWAELIHRRFTLSCTRLGLNKTKVVLRSDLFEPPEQGRQTRLL
jgi:hypothetical protein